jgi:hypothetical protein
MCIGRGRALSTNPFVSTGFEDTRSCFHSSYSNSAIITLLPELDGGKTRTRLFFMSWTINHPSKLLEPNIAAFIRFNLVGSTIP